MVRDLDGFDLQRILTLACLLDNERDLKRGPGSTVRLDLALHVAEGMFDTLMRVAEALFPELFREQVAVRGYVRPLAIEGGKR